MSYGRPITGNGFTDPEVPLLPSLPKKDLYGICLKIAEKHEKLTKGITEYLIKVRIHEVDKINANWNMYQY